MTGRNVTAMVRFSGTVQGVFFRKNTSSVASRLGITGWVRNEADGTVSACFSGPELSVMQVIEECRHLPRAVVTGTDVEMKEYVYYGVFDIR